jgi:hypothetical protein
VTAPIEVPGDHEAVAGVVALAGTDDDRTGGSQRDQQFGRSSPGVFHQHQARDAVLCATSRDAGRDAGEERQRSQGDRDRMNPQLRHEDAVDESGDRADSEAILAHLPSYTGFRRQLVRNRLAVSDMDGARREAEAIPDGQSWTGYRDIAAVLEYARDLADFEAVTV